MQEASPDQRGPSILARWIRLPWIVDIIISIVVIRAAIAYFQWLPDGAVGIVVFVVTLLVLLLILAMPIGKPPQPPLPPGEWGQPPSSR